MRTRPIPTILGERPEEPLEPCPVCGGDVVVALCAGTLITVPSSHFPEPTLGELVARRYQRKPSLERFVHLAANMLICKECKWQAVDWGSMVENPERLPQRGIIS